jgi:hypothetical protein
MKKQATFDEIFIQYYQGIMLFGVVMVAIAVWLYEYYYTTTGDDLIGIITACALFFGTLLLGQGIRGWRDGEDIRNRFINVRRRDAGEVVIEKKRRRIKW